MISIDGKEYRTLEEQVKYLTDNMGGEGAKLTEINVGKPDAVVYDSTDGALVTCKATVTYEDETSEEIDFEYYVPIIPGSNINIDASESDDRIVISATGGGGGTYTGGDGITVDANNAINANLGDGLEIDGDNNIAVKVDNDGYIGFSDDGVSLNNAGKNAIASVAGKLDANQISGTNDGTNWTQIQIKGVTKNIPSGGGSGGVTDVKVNGTSVVTDNVANIPLASDSAFGVHKIRAEYGIAITTSGGNPGTITTNPASDANIAAKADGYKPIVSNKLDKAVMEGLGNNSLTWSDAYKTKARNTIGAGTPLVISAAPGVSVASSGNNRTIGLDLAEEGGLETDGNDELAVDFDVVQHKLTAGSNITISGNTISAASGITTISPGPGINVGSSGSGRTINLDLAADGGLETDGNDELAVDFDVVQHKLTAGTNITISGNTISATGGGGSQHLYRHEIHLNDSEATSYEVDLILYTADSAAYTSASQLITKLPSNENCVPISGWISSRIVPCSICQQGGQYLSAVLWDKSDGAFDADFTDATVTDTVVTIF